MSPRRTTPWPAGSPCWLDVTTTDLDAAKAFYSALLGWEWGEGDPQYGGYSLATVDGQHAAGIAPVMEGGDPAWTLYFASDDIAATATAIGAAGGTVVAPVMEIGPMGSMLVAVDPAGASFGVWQSGEHTGIRVYSEPGGLSWEDLRSSDPDAARDFYGAAFGWTYQALEMAGPDYSTFHRPGDEAPMGGLGGMMGMEGFPSHWIVYLGVADVDACVSQVEELGGHILSPGFDTPYGRMAAVTDPFGASFWLVTPDPAAMPDRSE
jgi:predicted enzyme related to lactoylglutathione lyase